jgi:hypothetical protein
MSFGKELRNNVREYNDNLDISKTEPFAHVVRCMRECSKQGHKFYEVYSHMTGFQFIYDNESKVRKWCKENDIDFFDLNGKGYSFNWFD